MPATSSPPARWRPAATGSRCRVWLTSPPTSKEVRSMADAAPRVAIGPEPDALIEDAVRRGGGAPAAVADADAIVWLGGPDALRPVLHPGIRWVQLPSAGVERWVAS